MEALIELWIEFQTLFSKRLADLIRHSRTVLYGGPQVQNTEVWSQNFIYLTIKLFYGYFNFCEMKYIFLGAYKVLWSDFCVLHLWATVEN